MITSITAPMISTAMPITFILAFEESEPKRDMKPPLFVRGSGGLTVLFIFIEKTDSVMWKAHTVICFGKLYA